LTSESAVTPKQLKVFKADTSNHHVLSLLVALTRSPLYDVIQSMEAFRKHVDRETGLRSDRTIWLLSRLLSIYALCDLDINRCRKRRDFVRHVDELNTHKTTHTAQMVISAHQIWMAILKLTSK